MLPLLTFRLQIEIFGMIEPVFTVEYSFFENGDNVVTGLEEDMWLSGQFDLYSTYIKEDENSLPLPQEWTVVSSDCAEVDFVPSWQDRETQQEKEDMYLYNSKPINLNDLIIVTGD